MLRECIPRYTTQVKSKQLTEFSQYLALVAEIDGHLTRGTRHFYNFRGELLRELDQVVDAILVGNLINGEGSSQ